MAKIHELSENLSNQIAAGEVIERPASVVKELVENSIDAGASRIRIDVVDSGLKQIVVQDNGVGIAPDQIDLAFTRHATSKINNERDLFNVATLGFRGEALASISAVAHVEILTNDNNEVGTRAKFSAGKKLSQEDAGASKGTKITVKDLFFNTPARLKYLNSPRTEMMKIVDIVNRIALGYPQISISLANAGKILLRTPGNGNLKQTVANIYGRSTAEKMTSFEEKDSDFKVDGLMSKPELTRSTRNYISILLNGRYIRNYQLTSAIIDGYGSKLGPRHYPIIVIDIHVDPLLVDVNVHPTKQEVRLSKEKELSRLITKAISDTLIEKDTQINAFEAIENGRSDDIVDQLRFNLNKSVVDTKRKADEPAEVREENKAIIRQDKHIDEVESDKSAPNYVDINKPQENDKYVITASWDENVQKQIALTPFNNKVDAEVITSGDETLASNLAELEYLGQMDAYILAQNKGDLYLVDQVAARRRLEFEKIRQVMNSKKIPQQGLLTPVVLEFGKLDFLQIKDNLDEIKKLGIYLDIFGDNSFIVRSYPTWINGEIETSLRHILDIFLNLDAGKKENFFIRVAADEAHKKIASKNKLNAVEAKQILSDLRQTADPYHDADGRIVLVKISQNDIRKMFKRND